MTGRWRWNAPFATAAVWLGVALLAAPLGTHLRTKLARTTQSSDPCWALLPEREAV